MAPERTATGQVVDCRRCTDQIFGPCAEHSVRRLPNGTRIALKVRPGSLGFRMDDWPVGIWTSNVVFTITEYRQGSPPDIPPWYVARFGDDHTPVGVDVTAEGVDWEIVDEESDG